MGGRVIPARCEQRAGRRFVGRKWTLPDAAGPCRPCSNDQQQASSSAYAVSLDSAPAYRLYLSLCWLWDRHGTAGGRLIGADQPIHLVNPVALHRYPALSPDHLAQMAYATADLAAEGSNEPGDFQGEVRPRGSAFQIGIRPYRRSSDPCRKRAPVRGLPLA